MNYIDFLFLGKEVSKIIFCSRNNYLKNPGNSYGSLTSAFQGIGVF